MGDWKMEFNRLCDYAYIIKQINPRSSCWIRTDSEIVPDKNLFVHFYLCLRLGDGVGLTVMPDMQKGLVPTINELLPMAEHRMCVRHILSNWSKNWRDEERRKQFWRCAKASYEVKFKEELEAMNKLGYKICEDLLKYDKEYWGRASFREDSKSDVIENNMCETFNSWIVGHRHKSVITMLETIRHKIIKRTIKMRKFVETWVTHLAPRARLILKENKVLSKRCNVMWNAEHKFEVDEGVYIIIVDFINMTCTCRSWMLRGIPCQYAVCAFYDKEMDPDDYVAHLYRKEIFRKAYQHFIQPIFNMRMWPESTNPYIKPPEPKPLPVRPKRCRIKDKDEPRK
ncbi:uncharacterized protein LOC142163981 [Nicotiana tabacum]|uniref:Uncharacterized protein LOC142163981 n=1 Tax=Nicotiana tabacum TaxID=4097 RepID=A0AC58RWW1_TOBAC